MVTAKQIAALKYMIFNSRDGTELPKRVLAFLIDQSEGLTKEVCLTLTADREGYTADEVHAAGRGVGAMRRYHGTTHLNELLDLMESDLHFSHHYGDFDPHRHGDPFNTAGQFAGMSQHQVYDPELVLEGMPKRFTFWLAEEDYSRQATLVVATREELEQIDLRKPRLYPTLEPA